MRLILVLAGACALLRVPDQASAALGEAGGMTLLQPMAARPAALGEALAAGAGSVDALGYNPAGLASLRTLETGALYYGGFAGDTYVSALFGRPVLEAGAAAGVVYYDSGSVAVADPVTGELYEVSAQRDMVAHAGAGYRIPYTRIDVGLGGKVLNTTLIEDFSATQVAGDVGVRVHLPDLGLALGLAAMNIGPRMALEEDLVLLPFLVRVGMAYRVELPAVSGMLDSLDGYHPARAPSVLLALAEVVARVNEEVTSVGLGLEYIAGGAVAVRGGYRSIVNGAASGADTYTAGAGVRVFSLRLDYAIEILPFTVLHRVGLTFSPSAGKEDY